MTRHLHTKGLFCRFVKFLYVGQFVSSLSNSMYLSQWHSKVVYPIDLSLPSFLYCFHILLRGFRVTFNNISVISWRSVLVVKETGVLGENYRPIASHWQTVSHNVVSSTPRHERVSNDHDVPYLIIELGLVLNIAEILFDGI